MPGFILAAHALSPSRHGADCGVSMAPRTISTPSRTNAISTAFIVSIALASLPKSAAPNLGGLTSPSVAAVSSQTDYMPELTGAGSNGPKLVPSTVSFMVMGDPAIAAKPAPMAR